MDQSTAMRIFVRVAELASFTQAAQSLGQPKATVSLAVQKLESELGVRLLHRTTRRVVMTQDGQAFYERSKELLADLDELKGMFCASDADLAGRLRVDMPSGTAKTTIIPALPEFLRRYPGLEVELSSTDRRVDLVREGFDCVLRVGALADSSLVARPLGTYRLLNCASPDYLDRFGTPSNIHGLAGHRLVHYVPIFGARPVGFEYVDAAAAIRYVTMPGSLTVNNSDAYLAACLAGIGIIQVPEPAVRQYLADGRLVDLLPQWRAAPMPVSLLYASRRQLPRRVQVFMAWVAEVMRPNLQP
ncbi:MAG: LysR family transcriptional regulator [Betaproteobacteria bacterium]